ncbi:MAG: YdcF family protein [Elainellaceae cyanobacterium]
MTPLAIVVIALIGLSSPWFVNLLTWGLTFPLPKDSGDRVEAIVVLGRGDAFRDERFTEARQLWQEQRAPNIFASGMLDAKFITRDLEKSGVPLVSLAGEECSQTTVENALFTSALLRPQGIKDILLVSDAPHMLRAMLIFRSVAFDVTPHPIPIPAQLGTQQQRLKLVLREYAGLIHHALTGKFWRRSPDALDNPPPEVLDKIVDWNCKVPRASQQE